MTSEKSKHRVIRCPRCSQSCVYSPENEYRPFCSERCKTGDIAAWASDSYAVAGPAITEEEAEQLEGNDDDGSLPH